MTDPTIELSSSVPPASVPPATLLDLIRRPRGAALMLGHVHPDGDVLGTLLGLGLAMEAAGWSVTMAGPHAVPHHLNGVGQAGTHSRGVCVSDSRCSGG